MAEKQSATPDLASLWSEWLNQSERQWNTFLNETMSTDQFSESLGGAMDFYVAMQKGFNDQMARYLASMNMPSRADIMGVSDRLLEIENRLARIEALLTVAGSKVQPVAKKPSRTRKPPGE